jgi:hypothetical protein
LKVDNEKEEEFTAKTQRRKDFCGHFCGSRNPSSKVDNMKK